MKRACLGFLSLACFGGTAVAAAQVTVVKRYVHWEQVLRQRVNDYFYYPEAAAGAVGDVIVGFEIGADGKPANIVVRQSSRNLFLDRAATRLVAQLGRLGPIPSANSRIREIDLKLSYGDPSVTAGDSGRLEKADRQERAFNQRRDRDLISTQPTLASRR